MGILMKKPRNKFIFIPVVTVLSLIGLIVLTLVSYVGYVSFSYYRLGDTELCVSNNQIAEIVSADIGNKEFQITSYNIGFGAYDRDYSFFMDVSNFKPEYVDSQGYKDTEGVHGRAASKERVLINTNGAYNTIKNIPDLDFMLYQEVDTKGHRSFKVNQREIGNDIHTGYGRVFGTNYHSAYLAYPFHEPIGKSESGISTYSKYSIASAERKEFKITDSFFGKFFDLDRAFTISELPIDGSTKKLYIFNLHMSAYDESGVVRAMQLTQLKDAIKAARDIDGLDNYVVIGGDFNHDLVIDDPTADAYYRDNIFDKQETEILKTDWFNYLRLNPALDGTDAIDLITGENVPYHYDFKNMNITVHGPTNLGTARDASIPFQDKNNNGIIDNAMVTIDGFFVSDNINVTSVETIGSGGPLGQEETLPATDPRYGKGFVYSDHNPVLMKFILLP